MSPVEIFIFYILKKTFYWTKFADYCSIKVQKFEKCGIKLKRCSLAIDNDHAGGGRDLKLHIF
jgi:hypothetical protein